MGYFKELSIELDDLMKEKETALVRLSSVDLDEDEASKIRERIKAIESEIPKVKSTLIGDLLKASTESSIPIKRK